MKEEDSFRVSIKPTGNIVKEVGDNIEKLLKDKRKELAESATMVAGELIENAVKYGEPVDDQDNSGIEFEVKIKNDKQNSCQF